jgi:C-terminal processing protease CtpA/Prc
LSFEGNVSTSLETVWVTDEFDYSFVQRRFESSSMTFAGGLMKKLLTLFLVILGFSQGLGILELPPALQLFDEAVQVLSTRYANPREINPQAFSAPYRAELEKTCATKKECSYFDAEPTIRRMVDAVDDYHLDYKSSTMPARRRFVGARFSSAFIGFRVSYDATRVFVFYIERGSSADKEGIRIGDQILSIGKVVKPEQIVQMLIKIEEMPRALEIRVRHPNGTEFDALLSPTGYEAGKPFLDFKDEIAIISIPSFSLSVALPIFYRGLQDLQDLLWRAKKKGTKALILDLRGNDGGLRYYALSLACSVVPVTRIYHEPNNGLQTSVTCKNAGDTKVKYSDEPNNEDYDFSAKNPATWDKPIVILTSRITASAAENVTDVLQSTHKAVVIGEPTQGGLGTGGDGSAPLMNGGILWYSDSVSTDENGVRRAARITPDIYVKLDPDIFLQGRDPFMEAAFKYLEKR